MYAHIKGELSTANSHLSEDGRQKHVISAKTPGSEIANLEWNAKS